MVESGGPRWELAGRIDRLASGMEAGATIRRTAAKREADGAVPADVRKTTLSYLKTRWARSGLYIGKTDSKRGIT